MFSDLQYALRSLRKSPGFTVIVLLTLGLGIGATTAIFSVVNAVLLQPLAYKDPEKLVTLLHRAVVPVSIANYLDWRERTHSFSSMGAAESWSPNLTGTAEPEHLVGLRVTQSMLPMLGVQPQMGRLFAAGSDRTGAAQEVVLSHRLWQRRFVSDPAVLGKSVTLDGQAYTVIGVMPKSFKFTPFWVTKAELWVPLVFGERAHNRVSKSLRVFARLKADTTLEQARADVATVTARLERQFPGTNGDLTVTPLLEQVVGQVETPLLILLGAVGFLLLISCGNIAHMLLARSAGRQQEIAVRSALGASRPRLIRQLLTESLLLATLGGALGLLLAHAAVWALVILNPVNIPRVDTVSVDSWVILFLFVVTCLTSFGFGLAPALQISSLNLNDTLKEGGRGATDGVRHRRLRSIMVASELALALILLVGASLMIRSFIALQSIDSGFDSRHVLSMVVSVAGSSEAAEGRRESFYRQMLERVRALPGVESAAGINHLPLAGDMWSLPLIIEGRPEPLSDETPSAVYRIVTPGYLPTMRLPLLRGRDFSSADSAAGPPVVIINERAAQEYWPGENAVGKQLKLDKVGVTAWFTVVGVVKDAKQTDWVSKPQPEVYVCAFQNRDFMGASDSAVAQWMSYITLVVRASADPETLTASVKNAVWSLNGNLPISNIVTMDDVVSQANAQPRFQMFLLGAFALAALVLSAVGIYGVMSYSVLRRMHEIGVRISLGATARDVLKLIVGHGMALALIGSVLGLVGALFLARLMAHLLYEVRSTDLITFVAVPLLLLTVAFVASYIPARRATKVDPLQALRAE